MRNVDTRRRKGKLTWDQVIDLYRTKGVEEIADLDGTTYVTILKGLHRLGVKMRPQGGRIGPAWTKHGLYCQDILPGASPHCRLRWQAIKALEGKCCKCGNKDFRVLQFNHINGKDRPLGKTGTRQSSQSALTQQLQQIVSGKLRDTIDLRCANCNIIHEYERGNRKDIYAQC